MKISILFVAAILTPAVFADAQDVPSQDASEIVRRAAELISVGEPEAAIELYDSISDRPLSPEAIYNHAVALYRAGKFVSAAARFREVSQATDHSLVAKARHNLGNCFYSEALAKTESGAGIDDVKPLIQSAIDAYRSSLRLAPDDEDTRTNLELAVKVLDQLNTPQPPDQQQQKSDSSQQQEKPDEDDSSSKNEDGESSEQQNEPSDEPNEEEQSSDQPSSPNENDQAEDSSESSQNQSADEPETGDQNENADPSKELDGETSDAGSENMNPNQTQSDQDQQNSTSGANDRDSDESAEDSARQEDQGPDETKEGKLESAGSERSDTVEKGQPSDELPVGETGRAMTQQEAMKMLQAIRDRDMIRRYRREAAKRSRYIPVERDW